MSWLTALSLLRQERKPGVLVTVTEVEVMHPGRQSKMVVGTDRTWGSIGVAISSPSPSTAPASCSAIARPGPRY